VGRDGGDNASSFPRRGRSVVQLVVTGKVSSDMATVRIRGGDGCTGIYFDRERLPAHTSEFPV
jgi:hypothetical protein